MGNPNHDPKTGEFSSGPGGNGDGMHPTGDAHADRAMVMTRALEKRLARETGVPTDRTRKEQVALKAFDISLNKIERQRYFDQMNHVPYKGFSSRFEYLKSITRVPKT